MPSLSIVFFGTAELARFSLAALAGSPGMKVEAVVTQPDRPKGRDLKLQPSPVKVEAATRELPVLQPERARNPVFIEELAQYKPDLIVVAAYGQILPEAILNLPHYGCINVHASLLPKYRGAAPIQWAILNDERETGVTIMKMDAGLDTGEMLAREATPIEREDNSQTLHNRLAQLGAELLMRTIPDYVAGRISPNPQPAEGVSYARKLTKEDGRLIWVHPARALWNRVRAFTPWPGAHAFLPVAKQPLVKIWEAEVAENLSGSPGQVLSADREGVVVASGEQALRITRLQREGGRQMSAQEFLAGCQLLPGQKLRDNEKDPA
jgi:methionyl-tRNA formyltransferase